MEDAPDKRAAARRAEVLPSRRTALKIGVGAAAGAAVWSEPTIRGLARRPAYAFEGPGPGPDKVMITFTVLVSDPQEVVVDSFSPTSVGGQPIDIGILEQANNRHALQLDPMGSALTWDFDTLWEDLNRDVIINAAAQSGPTILRLRSSNGLPEGTYTVSIEVS